MCTHVYLLVCECAYVCMCVWMRGKEGKERKWERGGGGERDRERTGMGRMGPTRSLDN